MVTFISETEGYKGDIHASCLRSAYITFSCFSFKYSFLFFALVPGKMGFRSWTTNQAGLFLHTHPSYSPTPHRTLCISFIMAESLLTFPHNSADIRFYCILFPVNCHTYQLNVVALACESVEIF